MKKLRVKYIGRKEWQKDPFYKTGVLWIGQGDVKEVEEEAARKMAENFPSVWKLYEEGKDTYREEFKKLVEDNQDKNILDRIVIQDDTGKDVKISQAPYQQVLEYVRKNTMLHIPEGSTKAELLNQVEEIERLRDEYVRVPAADEKIRQDKTAATPKKKRTRKKKSMKPAPTPASKPIDEAVDEPALKLVNDLF